MRKKVLFLIIIIGIIFSYIKVEAKVSDISIKSIELIEKNGAVEEVNKPFFEGMNVRFDLIFRKLSDVIKYKVTIQNDGDENIYIENKGEFSSDGYVIYDYIWDDDENIIKANDSKTFEVVISYRNEVDDSKYQDGVYVENSDLVIKIRDDKGNVLPITSNPKTNSNLDFFVLILGIEILVILIIVVYLFKNNKLRLESLKEMEHINIIVLVVSISVVMIALAGFSYALEIAEIRVDSKIKISKARLARSCNSDSYFDDHSGYCIDWNKMISVDNYSNSIVGLKFSDRKNMDNVVTYNGVEYRLNSSYDVSDYQNENVILGEYVSSDGSGLIIIGQDDGVLAPFDMSSLFASYHCTYAADGSASCSYDNGSNIMYKLSLFDAKNLNTSLSTNMNYTFYRAGYQVNDLTYNMNNLKTSNVTSMVGTFVEAGYKSKQWQLNGISGWDTSNVQNMKYLFMNTAYNASNFTIDVSGWNTSQVENMRGMFNCSGYSASIWNVGDLSNWDTSSVENFSYTFALTGYSSNNWSIGDLSDWDVSKATDMQYMFNYAGPKEVNWNIGNLSKWDTSNVFDMKATFCYAGENATNFDISYVSEWDVSNVMYMTYLFAGSGYNSKTWTVGTLKDWDVSNNVITYCMFNAAGFNAKEFILDLSNWNVSKVTDMNSMFSAAGFYADVFDIGNISNWDVSNVTNMNGTFNGVGANANKLILDLSNWDVSRVKDMEDIFDSAATWCHDTELRLDSWDFSNVESYGSMFRSMPSTTKVYVKDEKAQQFVINNWSWFSTKNVLIST